MTALNLQPAPIDLAFLDQLVASQTLWSEREEEGAAIADHLLTTTAPIVVLHGPARSGKTELVRRRVVPLITEARPVSFFDCGESVEADLPAEPQTIAFWDRFESCLADASGPPDDVVRQLLRFTEGGADGCRIVLIVSDEALSRLFQLCGAVPHVVDDVREIPRLATRPLFEQLARSLADHGVNIRESFLAELNRDLDALHGVAGMELAAILAFELCRSNPGEEPATREYYEARGRLPGILEAHLDFLFERLPDGIDSQIGWAVLQEIASPAATTQAIDVAAVANRFDVPVDAVERVLVWLETTRRLAQPRATGGYDLVPPQLALAASARREREATLDEHQRWILRQAVRHFLESDALLSEQSFRRLHQHRSALAVTDEEAKLLLRCAIVYEDNSLAGATDHWMRRVNGADARVDVLLEALFDSRSDVRKRAARRLGRFPRHDVRNQLHLLALRDACADVRRQAIESLRGMKDDELRTSLVLELHQSNSPYRLQAIDALTIFDDDMAVAALVEIVRTNRDGEDAAGRRRAVDVLGRQQTPAAVEALLGVALEDPDPDDRHGAAGALAQSTSKPTLEFLLDRLDQARRSTNAWRVSMPLQSVRHALLHGALSVGAVLVGLFLHGFILATMKRWRAATAIALLQFFSLGVLLWLSREVAGVALFAASGLAGFIVPIQILLSERLEWRPQGQYRRCLAATVFAVCSITVFVCFHGLACALAKRYRRAFVLLGFEAIGVSLLLGANLVGYKFSGYAALSPVFGVVWWSLTIVGMATLAATWLGGVVPLWRDAFLWRARRERLTRIGAIEAELLQNATLPGLVLQACEKSAGAAPSWSRYMLRKFGRDVHGALRRYWESADIATKRTIFSAMARGHRAESMAFLNTASRFLGWRARARYVWSGFAYRVSLWPTPALVIVAIVSYVQIAAVAVLLAHMTVEPEALVRAVMNERSSPPEKIQAILDLQRLAEQQTDHVAAMSAASGLVHVVAAPEFTALDPGVRAQVLVAVAAVAPRSEEREALVDAVARLLGPADSQPAAIDTLKTIGTVEAIEALKAFIERPVLAGRRAKETPNERERDETRVKTLAIDAIAGMRGVGVESLKALNEVSSAPGLGADVKRAAENAAERLDDPLVHAEYRLAGKQYVEAVAGAEHVLAERPANPARAARARQILIRAHAIQGASAFAGEDYFAARDELFAAIASGGNARGTGLFDLGLNLAYHFHERVAPGDPGAYADAYELLSKLEPLASDLAVRTSVRVNLVEACLTSGQYAKAIALGRELLARPRLDPEWQLNTRFIVYASLVLSQRTSDAAQAGTDLDDYYAKLPAGFTNDWAYGGTGAYLQRASIPVASREELLGALAKIQRPK